MNKAVIVGLALAMPITVRGAAAVTLDGMSVTVFGAYTDTDIQ